MAIRVTRTFTRPNTEVPFYLTTPEWRAYSKANYATTGIRTEARTHESPNGLVRTIITVWTNRAAFDAFMADPNVQTLLLNPRQAYCDANNIAVGENNFQDI